MLRNNMKVRNAISYYKVRYWQVAKALGIAPQRLSEQLRDELSESKQNLIVDVCKSIAERREKHE